MQFISTKYHSIADYLVGIALICTPWVFYSWDGSFPLWVLVYSGTIIIGYSALTEYEYGLLKIFPVKFHFMLDMIVGLILMASPWLFNFYEKMVIPYVFYGALQISITLFTSAKRVHHLYTGYHPHHHHHNPHRY
jgi:hypothetical protein